MCKCVCVCVLGGRNLVIFGAFICSVKVISQRSRALQHEGGQVHCFDKLLVWPNWREHLYGNIATAQTHEAQNPARENRLHPGLVGWSSWSFVGVFST